MKLTSRPLVATVALAAALGLGACGSKTDTTSTTGTGTSQKEGGGASAKVGDTVSYTDLSAKVTEALKSAGPATVTMGMGTDMLKGVADYSTTPPSMDLGGTSSDFEMRIVYVDRVMYFSSPVFASMMKGKKWLKVDPSGTDQMSRSMKPLFGVMEKSMSPTSILEGIDGLQSKVTAVEGDKVTYDTTITGEQLKKVTDNFMKDMGAGMPKPSASMGTMVVKLTLDGKSLPVKSEVTGAATKGGAITMTYADWGKAAKVAAPPAAEIGTFDMSGLMPSPTS